MGAARGHVGREVAAFAIEALAHHAGREATGTQMVSSRYLKTRGFGLALFAAMLVANASAADPEMGKKLFEQCAQCHGVDGEGSRPFLAPSIAGMNRWYVESQLRNFRSGARGLHPDDVGGLRMYPIARSLKSDRAGWTEEEKIEALSDYVANLPEVIPAPEVEGGDPEKGAVLYATCQQCHGAAGEGNEQMNSPRLAGTSDWYLVTELQQYKQGIRGSNPQNPNAVLMRGMSNMLADDQAIRDVVAYIATLKPVEQKN